MAIGPERNSTASSRAKTATATAAPTPCRFSNEPLVALGSAVWNANFDAPARRAHEELEREHLLPELRPFSQQEFPAPARAAGPKLLDPHRLQRRAAAQATIVATCGLRHFRRGHRSPSEIIAARCSPQFFLFRPWATVPLRVTRRRGSSSFGPAARAGAGNSCWE